MMVQAKLLPLRDMFPPAQQVCSGGHLSWLEQRLDISCVVCSLSVLMCTQL